MTERLRLSYIGEPIAAAGFAVIGARIHTPAIDDQDLWRLIHEARRESDLLLINYNHTLGIKQQLAMLLEKEPVPPILAVPAMHHHEDIVNVIENLARQMLGITAQHAPTI